MSARDKRKKTLIRKFKPLSKKEVKKRFKEMKRLKDEMTTDATILEQNLKKFNEITDPIVDPESGDALCWVRRPTAEELEALVPTELLEYRNSPDKVPKEIMKKHADFQFKMMAEMIDIPRKDAKWWKKNANQVFQMLFQMHLRGVMEDLGISAENF